ncbi:low molecular weight protein-tyrosine-phosphatase [Thiolinea disciformis]|uniref:low molecular weight protein-tyrosine-phosphatase n=1 Tax=Thiolinea disciformis TaxID=125614 RepID=UPI00035C66B3|nr:low molecular weight protein-tyrosine-phosphatase [Thiolinea disciformis]
MAAVSVLFVCMGNICRSPTAQGVFEALVRQRGWLEQIQIDSAGTHAYHIGSSPDERSQAAALERGVDLSQQRARQVRSADFEQFNYILAMDRQNFQALQALAANSEQRQRVYLMMDFAQRWQEREVPDPYYGGAQGFQRVLDMVEDASEGLLAHLAKQHRLRS